MRKIPIALIYVFLYSLFWAINIIISRFVLKAGFNPLILTLEQNFFAALFLSFFLFFQFKTLTKTSKTSLLGAMFIGCFGSGFAVLLSQYGLSLSTSINYSFLIMTSTVFTVIIAKFLLKEAISGLKLIFLSLMMLGAFLLSTKGQMIIPNKGDIYILIAAVFFGVTANISRLIIKKDIQPNLVSFFRVFSAWITISLIYFISGHTFKSLTITFPVILIGFFQAVLLFFLNQAFKVASASYVTMISMITPVLVALMAYPLLGEKLIFIQIIGALAIIVGGVLTQIKKAA
ncbi:MAG: DMT family transporter [Patescibacteria group bacterium]